MSPNRAPLFSDIVLKQQEFTYDSADNIILMASRARYDESAVSGTGELGDPSSTMQPKARVSYVANYYDAANRLTDSVNVGTNGGTAYTRPGSPDSRSDTVLVTSYGYDDAGRVKDVTDPRAIISRTTHDLLGRTTKVIEAYDDGTPSANNDQTTEYTYDASGNVLTMKAVLPSSAFQETKYIYGEADKSVSSLTRSGSTATATITAHGFRAGESINIQGANETEYNGTFTITSATANTFSFTVSGSPSTPATGTIMARRAHAMYNNDVLISVQYPDKTSGSASASQSETFTINALGENTSYIDRGGNVHGYTYDLLGRRLFDEVTKVGALTDGTVRKLGFTFDSAGRPFEFISYDSSSGVLNQVRREYNGFGQLVTEYQEHDGAVNTGTSKKVQYDYSEMSGGDNHSRLESITYPSGRIIHYVYDRFAIDDGVSRATEIAEDDGTGDPGGAIVQYNYLGDGTLVYKDLTAVGVEMNTGIAANDYSLLDRFNRVTGELWFNYNSTPVDLYENTLAYDRNSNLLYRENLLDATKSELYHGGTGYDLLNRITNFKRGTLNGTKDGISGSPSRTQDWTLDALGNWSTITTDGTAKNRTHNKQNQMTQIGAVSYSFDGNGNMTGTTARTFKYDAWNRMVNSTTGGFPTVIDFKAEYDATGRRIVSDGNGLFYSDQWQVLEEHVGSGTTSGTVTEKIAYVWGQNYVDELVRRYRDTNVDGTDDESLYAIHDSNFTIKALVDGNGDVIERFEYDAYGSFKVLDANWAADANGTSDVNWIYLHQGGRYQKLTPRIGFAEGFYHFRNRDYSPELGRWMQQDPLGYVDGMSLYEYVKSSPVSHLDPAGMQTWIPTPMGPWVPGSSTPPPPYYPEPTPPQTPLIPGEWRRGWWDAFKAFLTVADPEIQNAYGSGVADGLMAWTNGAVKWFGQPFDSSDFYDPCDKTLKVSEWMGGASRNAWLAALLLRGMPASQMPHAGPVPYQTVPKELVELYRRAAEHRATMEATKGIPVIWKAQFDALQKVQELIKNFPR